MHIITPDQWEWLNRYGHIIAVHPPWIMSTDGRQGCFIKSDTLLGEPVEWLNVDSPAVITADTQLLPHGLDLDWQKVLKRFEEGEWELDNNGWLVRHYTIINHGTNVLLKSGNIHLSLLEATYRGLHS